MYQYIVLLRQVMGLIQIMKLKPQINNYQNLKNTSHIFILLKFGFIV